MSCRSRGTPVTLQEQAAIEWDANYRSAPGFGGDSFDWVHRLPDGAVSVANVEGALVLRASHQLQGQFEELLAKHKAGSLSADE
jgi:hypothetical protein